MICMEAGMVGSAREWMVLCGIVVRKGHYQGVCKDSVRQAGSCGP